MECQITIKWTDTAKESLKILPKKVRKGILDKADELLGCCDPRRVYKPLKGPLEGLYRIVYSRYRAVFRVEEERLATGGLLLHVTVVFVATGIRKKFDKKDVYNVAKKLVERGLAGEVEEVQVRSKTQEQ